MININKKYILLGVYGQKAKRMLLIANESIIRIVQKTNYRNIVTDSFRHFFGEMKVYTELADDDEVQMTLSHSYQDEDEIRKNMKIFCSVAISYILSTEGFEDVKTRICQYTESKITVKQMICMLRFISGEEPKELKKQFGEKVFNDAVGVPLDPFTQEANRINREQINNIGEVVENINLKVSKLSSIINGYASTSEVYQW